MSELPEPKAEAARIVPPPLSNSVRTWLDLHPRPHRVFHSMQLERVVVHSITKTHALVVPFSWWSDAPSGLNQPVKHEPRWVDLQKWDEDMLPLLQPSWLRSKWGGENRSYKPNNVEGRRAIQPGGFIQVTQLDGAALAPIMLSKVLVLEKSSMSGGIVGDWLPLHWCGQQLAKWLINAALDELVELAYSPDAHGLVCKRVPAGELDKFIKAARTHAHLLPANQRLQTWGRMGSKKRGERVEWVGRSKSRRGT